MKHINKAKPRVLLINNILWLVSTKSHYQVSTKNIFVLFYKLIKKQ